MKDKKLIIVIIILSILLAITICILLFRNPSVPMEPWMNPGMNMGIPGMNGAQDGEQVELGKTTTLEDIDIKIDADNGDKKIDWTKYETQDIELKESITISKGGIYNLTGKIDNGCIRVNTNADVKLVLNNVSIKNSQGPAIYIEEAENIIISLKEDSSNYVEDSENYIGYEEDVKGVIYSKDDIVFEGTGKLEVIANNEDGIVGKDDLKIIDGTYIINSKDDGIRGKDSVYILNGNFDITSGGDAIKSNNDSDAKKGFVWIENGTFKIVAELDGIQAETKMLIENGEFDITTGGGSANSSNSSEQSGMGNWGKWGQQNKTKSTDTSSAKGLKSADNLVIKDGTFNLNTSDDSIHSNKYVGIKSGTINISSGDDGIHADTELVIDGGNINIEKSYEGLEAAKITINDGEINVVAKDDGINVAGGSDSSGMNRVGQGKFTANVNNVLVINGGKITVDASGDGLDTNGSGYINGGEIVVNGPTDSGNGYLDYDGAFYINGGKLIGIGFAGQMMAGVSSSSKQNSVMINFDKTYSSGTNIKIVDSSNNIVAEYTAKKNFTAMTISNSSLKSSSTYIVKVNDEEYTTFTIEGASTVVGDINNGGMFNKGNGDMKWNGGMFDNAGEKWNGGMPDINGNPGMKGKGGKENSEMGMFKGEKDGQI